MKAPILLAFLGLATAQAAEPTGTLTLACKGTTEEKPLSERNANQEPVSMGIIVGLHRWNSPEPAYYRISGVDEIEKEVSVQFTGRYPKEDA